MFRLEVGLGLGLEPRNREPDRIFRDAPAYARSRKNKGSGLYRLGSDQLKGLIRTSSITAIALTS